MYRHSVPEMRGFTRCGLLLLATVTSILAYPRYQLEIPNGNNVPHPCKVNYLWHGVGHEGPLGGGSRNSFGKDFAKHKMWTKELCQMDSDGDGMSNGKELGDPGCTWNKGGSPPTSVKGITHPGICNPWGSKECNASNYWVTCETGEFECDAIKAPDVRNITLSFPKTLVPNKETNYYCMIFELPRDQDYHLIAYKPEIDNANVMHHTLLYGCSEGTRPTSKPEPCDMSLPQCFHLMGGWTVGAPGDCINANAGFRFGKSGKSLVAMEFHWNNPELKNDYEDGSGMTLYYTPKLRDNDAAALWVGQSYLKIDPGQESVVKTAECSAKCTKLLMLEPISIFTGFNHMHYLGTKETIKLYRDGKEIAVATSDDPFQYDRPTEHLHTPPLVMKPGDVMKTTCTFRSVSRKTTTYYGDGTADEMCYGFIAFYPAKALVSPDCLKWKNLDLCEFYSLDGMVQGCNGWQMFNHTNPDTLNLFRKVLASCNYYGECRKECPEAVKKAKENPCLQGELGEFILHSLAKPNVFGMRVTDMGFKFALAMKSCDVPPPLTPTGSTNRVYQKKFLAVFLCLAIIVTIL